MKIGLVGLALVFTSACGKSENPDVEDAGVEPFDAGPFAISIAPAEASEGDAGTTPLMFTVTLTPAPPEAATIHYETADGTATQSDYQPAAGTLSFAAGETVKTISVAIIGDGTHEPDETFTVRIYIPFDNLGLVLGTATGTIRNDDPQPTVSVADVAGAEGTGSAGQLVFTVTLSSPSASPITVAYALTDGTASGTDYVNSPGTLSFAPGELSATVTVALLPDALDEADETITLTLSTPTNATLGNATASGTITDDDALPSLTINDSSVAEGDTGSPTVAFTVTLGAASGRAVLVDFATASGTATSGTDFTAANGSLTFAPGETTRTINVAVTSDLATETDETFVVSLTNPTFATVAVGQGTGTILNDDLPIPAISVANTSTLEGDAPPAPLSFAVTLSSATNKTIAVDWGTIQGSAQARGFQQIGGTDFASASGRLSFAPGETSKTVIVYANGDYLYEPDETFTLVLGNAVNGTLAVAQATGTIINDDAQPQVDLTSNTIMEGNNGTKYLYLTVNSSRTSQAPIYVNWTTSDLTATAASDDYIALSGVATIVPSATNQVVSVPVNGDTLPEAYEQLRIAISAPVGATLGGQISVPLGIINDDATPTLSVKDASVTEPGSGSTTLSFEVTLSLASALPVTMSFGTSDGTAVVGSDYTAATGTLTFAAGETTKFISVTVTGDTVAEGTEIFNLSLSTPTNALIADGAAVGTIRDDDSGGPAINLANVAITEGDLGPSSAAVLATLSAPVPAGQSVSFDYTTADGTATAGSDYTFTSGTLTFTAGQTQLPILINVIGDTQSEVNETFFVRGSNPRTGTGSGPYFVNDDAVVTLNDNDGLPAANISDVTIAENVSASFTVTLGAASGRTVTIRYATSDGTAVAAGYSQVGTQDYTQSVGTVTFAPGETTKDIVIPVTDDLVHEPSETFFVNLSLPSGATLADNQAMGTITNNELVPAATLGDSIVTEGTFGQTYLQYVIQLSSRPSSPVTVSYSVAGGTATAGTDFDATSGSVTFVPGDTTMAFQVPVFGDRIVEPDETVTVTVTGISSNATITDGNGTGTITNDD